MQIPPSPPKSVGLAKYNDKLCKRTYLMSPNTIYIYICVPCEERNPLPHRAWWWELVNLVGPTIVLQVKYRITKRGGELVLAKIVAF